MFYDRQGRPLADAYEWGRLIGDPTVKRVAETILPDGTWVSTVWLGIPHGECEGKPLIFETMVFPSDGTMNVLDCTRYSSEAEALIGHERMVTKWSQ